MGITFEQLPGSTAPGWAEGSGKLKVKGFAHAETLATLGAIGLGSLRLIQAGSGGTVVPPPMTSAFGSGMLILRSAGSAGAGTYAEANGEGQFKLVGTADASDTIGYGVLFLVGTGHYDLYVPPAPYEIQRVDEWLLPGALVQGGVTAVLLEHLRTSQSVSARASTMNRVAETLTFDDALHIVFAILVEEGIRFDSIDTLDSRAIARVVERLLIEGLATSYAEAVGAAVSGMTFGAMLEALALASAADTILAGDVLAEIYQAVAAAIDTALFGADGLPSLTAMVLLEEGVLMGDVPSTAAELTALARESIGFVMNLTLNNGEYVAWVLNTESRGLSRYTNYPFNSYMKLGGRYFGVTDTGLYQLDGDDDAGAPIAAKIRLGMSDLGTRVLKQIPEAYIGYSSDGTMLLRSITPHPKTGERQSALYKLMPRGAATSREGRFKGGRGVESVEWDFVIENVDGAGFELDSIQFLPVRTSRRTRS